MRQATCDLALRNVLETTSRESFSEWITQQQENSQVNVSEIPHLTQTLIAHFEAHRRRAASILFQYTSDNPVIAQY